MDANFPELAATGKKDDEKTYKFTGCKRKTPGDTGGANSSSAPLPSGALMSPPPTPARLL